MPGDDTTGLIDEGNALLTELVTNPIGLGIVFR